MRSQRRKIARTDQFGQLGDAAQDPAASSIPPVTRNASRFGSHKNFLEAHCLFLSSRTRAPRFFSQENFFTAIENKIDFFLVDFATDFYSQARWRGRQ